MKNILICTDFSENAYNALLYAAHLFKNEACRFYLLHSFENQITRSTSRVDIGRTEQIMDQLLKETDENMGHLKHSIVLDTEGFGHQFETLTSSKTLFREINFLIVENAIDYVVMGTKGITAAKGVLLGSSTVKVIKKLMGCPLLLIPVEIDFEPIEKIAFTTGFKRSYSDFQLNSISTLAKIHSAKIFIVHIREEEKIGIQQREHLFQLKKKLELIWHDVYWIDKGASKTEAILDFVLQEKIDLLAMINYKHGFINSLFRESVVKKISTQPGIPFLMIPATS
jgi:nucleotide-binding universal stress UspA family protein